MKFEMKVACFRALGDPTRLHIVNFLAKSCCGRAAVRETGEVESPTAGEVCCHITGGGKVTSTISHHLHELESCGVIRMSRKGKSMLCTLQPNVLEELAGFLTEFAKGRPDENCCC